MKERHRFDVIDQEQLAAQLVAVMDAHFQRPSSDEKRHILKLATQQIEAAAIVQQVESRASGLRSCATIE